MFQEQEKNDFDVELAAAQGAAAERIHPLAPKPQSKSGQARLNDELAFESEGQLTIDVYQTPVDIFVESAIAGVKPEDLDVDVTTDSVTIRGERRHEKEVKNSDYLYQECYWGKFSRSVILPQEVDPENAEVSLKSGILTIKLPKLNKQKSKKLKVRAE